MKVVITGGNGYIGGRLSLFLTAHGHEVTAVCFSEIPQKEGWTDIIHQTLIGDITNQETIKQISELNADAIIHLVSLDHFDSENDPNFAAKVNIQPTWNLLEKCSAKGLKKFIYFSTVQVYGKNQNGIIVEDQTPTPFNAYGLTHYLSEEICNFYNRKTITSCINIRLSNSYGEPVFNDANCWDLVINNLCLSAIENGKIILKGDGTPKRDFINYKTICECINQILSISAESNRNTFHLSSGISISMLDAAFIVQKTYKNKYKKNIEIYINGDELVEKQLPFSKVYAEISNKHLKSLINLNPLVLEEGVLQIFDYLDKNKIDYTTD